MDHLDAYVNDDNTALMLLGGLTAMLLYENSEINMPNNLGNI